LRVFSGLFGPKPKDKKGKGSAPGKNGKPARGGKSAAPKGGKGKGQPAPPPPPPGMSLDTKLDILGIFLAFLGVITALSLFTANPTGLLLAWLNLLWGAVGWGVYGLPLFFLAGGLWLIVRKFGDKLPKFDPEQYAGVPLLYLAFLVSVHFWATGGEGDLFAIIPDQQGGGALGAIILQALIGALGQAGTVVLLIAWWIISIAFTAGMSVGDMAVLIANRLRQLRVGEGAARQLPLPPTNGARPASRPTERIIAREPVDEVAPRERPAAPPTPPASAKKSPDKTTTPARPAPVTSSPDTLSPSPAAPYDQQPIVIGGDQPWELPKLEEMLDPGTEGGADDEFDRQRVQIIENTLASFGAPVKVVEINRGPTITQFGVEPDYIEQRGGKKVKVKVGKIAALADDLALALSAQSIRIEAPVPGKGYVGIEVPNIEISLVALRDVMESEAFLKLRRKSSLALGFGQDVSGTAISADLAAMPHLLIAGTTGSGKSVCVNSIIACLLLQNTPDDLKLMMVDPKRVELTNYNGIPHLMAPVVVDLERVVASLQWMTREMDERYRRFAKAGTRNIADYNARVMANGEKKMPYIIVVIDELADLMMLAPDETERIITRLAQLARATGIHLIIATQRPSVDVVTGLIKANFPARIAFAVASSVDSRVILDQPGAERLLGRGDMLLQSPDAAAPLRMQGVFVSDKEIQNIVRYWKGARGVEQSLAGMLPDIETSAPVDVTGAKPQQKPLWDPQEFGEPLATPEGEDEMLADAIAAVREMKKASISLLQRRLRIGYTRAARLIDVLEEKGIIGPAESGAKPREVIDFGDEQIVDPAAEESGNRRQWDSSPE
jgi:S-DNA-T family DNA segregation ATPase FtsK/SpoIIIE